MIEELAMMAIVAVVVGLVFGFLGLYIASQKGRSETEGFLFGFLLGPFGVVLVALLPTKEKGSRQVKFHEGPKDEDWEAIRDRMR